jgi:hypothetical protein
MTMIEQLTALGNVANADIYVKKYEFNAEWIAVFQYNTTGKKFQTENRSENMETAVQGMWDAVMEAGSFGIPEVKPLMLSAGPTPLSELLNDEVPF